MPELAIIARPVLGGLQGHRDHGKRSAVPDPARLFSALVHSAGTGSTAEEREGDLRITSEVARALAWLEVHPPSALMVPPLLNEPLGARAYRDEGVLEGKPPQARKVNKEQSDFTAFAGPLGWGWQEDVPAEVIDVVRALCEDVSCLGEADTPVVLEVGPIEPTHFLDADASGFPAPGGLDMRAAAEGRLAGLEQQYNEMNPRRRPSVSQDRHNWNQKPSSPVPTTTGLASARYRPIEPPLPDLPWDSGLALTLDHPIEPTERVQWAVTLHRAIVARLGDEAPSVVTGKYLQDAHKPANRVAIQYVCGPTAREDLRAGAFVIMLPQGMQPSDVNAVLAAVKPGMRLYRGADGSRQVRFAGPVDLEQFWLPPLPGSTRLWRAVPAIVPEMRPPRGDQTWKLEDSLKVSLGMVFRHRLSLPRRARGEERYRAIRDQVAQWPAELFDVRRIADSRTERYVHRVPRDLVAQPVRAVWQLDGLVSPTALLAVGQSRHLGGGLFEPMDVSSTGARHGAQ